MPISPKIPEGFTAILSPVQRLEILLRRAVSEQPLSGQSTGVALSMLVGLHPPDQRRNWSRAYVEITSLLDEARQYSTTVIASFDDSPHARTFDAIHAVFSQVSLENGWSTYVPQLNHLANIALPFVVHATDGIGQPPVIQSELLAEVRRDLDALLEKILESSLPPEFKDDFAHSIDALRDTLIRFHVYGPQGVARAAALVVGHVAVNETAAKSDRAVLKETADLISKIQDVFLKSFQMGKIGAAVWKLLGPGS
jgi:hypothetical protein